MWIWGFRKQIGWIGLKVTAKNVQVLLCLIFRSTAYPFPLLSLERPH